MRKSHIAALWSLVLMLAVASCCPCRKAANNNHRPLLSTEWSLVQMDGKNITEAFASEGAPRLVLGDDGNFGGYGGCNSMGGTYKMIPSELPSQRDVAGKVTFGGIYSTKRMCPSEGLEMTFFKALSECDSFTIEGTKLFLFHNGELTLVFEAQQQQ